MKRKLSIILSVSILLMASCRKDAVYTAPPTPHSAPAPVSSELLAHFSFLPGTYWIYKDSLNGRLDSFYVSSNSNHVDYTNYRDPNSGIVFNIIFIQEQNIDHTAESDSALWQFKLYRDMFDYVEYDHNRGSFFIYPFSTSTGHTVAIDTTFILHGNTFKNVAETINHNSYEPVTEYDQIYLNDSIGIIKMSFDKTDTAPPSHVWELVRWHITK